MRLEYCTPKVRVKLTFWGVFFMVKFSVRFRVHVIKDLFLVSSYVSSNKEFLGSSDLILSLELFINYIY